MSAVPLVRRDDDLLRVTCNSEQGVQDNLGDERMVRRMQQHVRSRGTLQRTGETVPLRIRHGSGRHPAVGGFVNEVLCQRVARGLQLVADDGLTGHALRPGERDHRVEHRELDVLPFPAALACEQGGGDRL